MNPSLSRFRLRDVIDLSEQNIFKAAAFLCAGAVGLILISAFSSKLSSLDQGLAQWALERGEAFDNGLVAALNFEQTILSVIGILIWLAPLALIFAQIPRSQLHWKGDMLRTFLVFAIHSVVLMVAYLLICQGVVGLLKVVFSRPRPIHTLQYSGKDNVDGCLVDYFQGFRVYHGANPCGRKFHSCPSGHTQWVAAICLINIFQWLNCIRFMKERVPRTTTSRKVCFAVSEVVFLLILIASPVFTVTVGLARISAKKHFFTDVTGAVCISVCFAALLQLFRWHHDDSPALACVADDSQSSEGDTRGTQAVVPSELV